MGTAQSKNLMLELKLTGMLGHYENALHSAISDGIGHCGKFAFEDFDYSANRSITKAQVKDLMSLKWLDQARPILLIGQTGVGKSFIAQACAMQACRHGKSSLWLDISALLESLALSRTSGTYIKLRDKLSKPDVLVIDDFGMRKLTSTEAQDLCELLELRQDRKSTIITTQLPLDHWGEVIEDPVIADAVTDRLKHLAITLKLTGATYRMVKAKKLDGGDLTK